MSEKPDAGRADYNERVRFNQFDRGEPVFMIRGRDALSGPAVRAWAALAHDAFVPLAVVEQALKQADAMDAWPDKRRPDADHLGPDEVLQNTFEFERRAWNARAESADTRVMLAEERALTAAQSRMRPVLATLFAGLEARDDGSYIWRMPTNDRGKPEAWPDPFEALRHLATVVRPAAADERQ